MKYFVQILCVILTIVLSLTTCQHASRERTEHPADIKRRLPNAQQNQVKFPINGFFNVIVFLLFLHLMLIIRNRFLF